MLTRWILDPEFLHTRKFPRLRSCCTEFIQEYKYEFGVADNVGRIKQIPLNSYTSRIIIWDENYIIKRMFYQSVIQGFIG